MVDILKVFDNKLVEFEIDEDYLDNKKIFFFNQKKIFFIYPIF
jgi:hypothetical protein